MPENGAIPPRVALDVAELLLGVKFDPLSSI
jgi:hypothetical protein